MKKRADDVQQMLEADRPTCVDDALYWLRWSDVASRVPEAFLFARMALERLVGEEERHAVCHCGKPVMCPEHGAHTYRGVRPAAEKEFLRRHGIENADGLLSLRHPLVHGSLKFTFEKRVLMREAMPRLWRTVEEELAGRLGATAALDIPLRGRTQSATLNIHCQYRTAFPNDPFPADCPDWTDVQEYMELIRVGRQHPKIITLAEWPPQW